MQQDEVPMNNASPNPLDRRIRTADSLLRIAKTCALMAGIFLLSKVLYAHSLPAMFILVLGISAGVLTVVVFLIKRFSK
jgi:hypothetical protein